MALHESFVWVTLDDGTKIANLSQKLNHETSEKTAPRTFIGKTGAAKLLKLEQLNEDDIFDGLRREVYDYPFYCISVSRGLENWHTHWKLVYIYILYTQRVHWPGVAATAWQQRAWFVCVHMNWVRWSKPVYRECPCRQYTRPEQLLSWWMSWGIG